MPRSRVRKKDDYTPPPARSPVRVGSPRWLAPVMVALFVIGLAWIVVYYLVQGGGPLPFLHAWNLVVGFAMILGGFVLATRWK